MQNHYHIVVRSGDRELWHLMKPLNTGYARYHKEKYRRDGPLFRDRYKSIVTQDQNYIGELVRYVHLNPVRAGICKDLKSLDAYAWSGHRALIGLSKCKFLDTTAVLNRFGSTVLTARKAYRCFLEERLNHDSDDTLLRLVRESNAGVDAGRKVSCWVIGDNDFVKKAISQAEQKRLRISRFEKEGGDLGQIAGTVAKQLGVPITCLHRRHRGGTESDARKVFVYVAIREYGVPSRIIADYCRVGLAAVSALAKAGYDVVKQNGLDIQLF
jgi:hypothetical protein